MLSVALSWLYILPVSYILGFAILHLSCGKQRWKTTDHLWAGFSVLTVFAEYWSLFGKVGTAVNIVLLIATVIIAYLFRKELTEELRMLFCSSSWGKKAAVLLLFFLFAFCTSTGYMHYDSDLYHAQSIRWIEEYGVVPGLANLHSRLGYNSAAFPLTALFSFRALAGSSLHVTSGLIAFYLALQCLPLFRKDILKSPKFSDLARIVSVYYLTTALRDIVSPASDFFIVIPAFALAVMWLDLIEEKCEDPRPFAVLSVFALLIVSFKLSAVMLVLLALKPGALFVREKKYKELFVCLGTGFFMTLPYLIRNVILSGYLVYPVLSTRIPGLDFAIPEAEAAYDSKEIRVFARGHSDVARFDESLADWFPAWFRALSVTDRFFFMISLVSIAVLAVFGLYCIGKKKKTRYDALFLTAVYGFGFCFWFFNSPLVRYGRVFLYLFPVLTAGVLTGPVYDRLKDGFRKPLIILWGVFLVLLGGYKTAGLIRIHAEMLPRYREYLVHQQDYGDYSEVLSTYRVGDVTVYYPLEGDRTGYAYFPSSTLVRENLVLRGASLKEGFRNEQR